MPLHPDVPYMNLQTLPIPESVFGSCMSHALSHSTDYSSISTLKKMLPRKDKQYKLYVGLEDIEGVLKHGDFKDKVLIHPGRGWPSKTFPKEWWREVIDGIGDLAVIIGKHVSSDQGYVDIDPGKAIDLRDKTSLGELIALISISPVLITNDSAPLHIAGAFDNNIILIPTCKHPEHILPWRNGSQDYKTTVLVGEKLLVDDIDNRPTQCYGQTIDYIPGGDINKYLPDPKVVINLLGEFNERHGS